IATVCGFRSPEDLAWVPDAAVLVVGEMSLFGGGGALAALEPRVDAEPRRLWPTGAATDFAPDPGSGNPACTPPDPAAFAPHGVTVDGARGLAVVNHGGRESIELFRLEGIGDATRAVWRGCVELPPGRAGNDLVVLPS